MRVRLAGVLAVTAISAAACNTGSAGTTAGPHGPAITQPQVAPSPHEPGPSALDDPSAKGLPKPLIDVRHLVSGGPPPDGIPAIDHPRFERVGDVGWLQDREPVLAFELDGDARAYPVQILVWHEIVNDTVAGIPVAITYCPLCNSALAFDRRRGARVLDFGTSGKLYRSDLVMYDRQTESLWVQFLGRAVAGRLTGTELAPHAVSTVSWREWRTAHPHGLVLSRETGFDRDYGANPYPSYDKARSRPFLLDVEPDPRLPPKTRVVGIEPARARPVAITFRRLRGERVIDLDAEGPVVVWYTPGTASGLDGATVAGGTDVGATGAFVPVVDGRHLHFTALPGARLRDRETGSVWTALGQAIEGPLVGTTLEPVVHVDAFWFAWAAFQPKARLLR